MNKQLNFFHLKTEKVQEFFSVLFKIPFLSCLITSDKKQEKFVHFNVEKYKYFQNQKNNKWMVYFHKIIYLNRDKVSFDNFLKNSTFIILLFNSLSKS